MEKSLEGVIIKGIGGFYYVDTVDALYECRARGLFRKMNIKPLVGDRVIINSIDDTNKTAFLFKISERENELIRPQVSNVSQIVTVISTENPKPNLYLLDKVIAGAEIQNIEVLVCINKTDLSSSKEYAKIYKEAGFNVCEVSAATEDGIDNLREHLKDKISVFAGNSGVGKSSLINLLLDEEFFETGEVSSKIERGRHTTRHTELKVLPFGGYIIDTPGFGTLEFSDLDISDYNKMFREFGKYSDNCRFNNCLHTKEGNCGVIEALNSGNISLSRYDSYKSLIDEFKTNLKNK